jgi:hypothetical protein
MQLGMLKSTRISATVKKIQPEEVIAVLFQNACTRFSHSHISAQGRFQYCTPSVLYLPKDDFPTHTYLHNKFVLLVG